MTLPTDDAYADALDRADPLAGWRERFVIADPDLIYLDGNSLGRLPVATRAALQTAIDVEWGDRLIRSWNEGWWERPQRIGGKLAGLLGAHPDELLLTDATSVNLYKLAVAALRWQQQQRPMRTRILTDPLNFPSDLYILEGAARAAGERFVVELVAVDPADPAPALLAALDDRVALLSLSHTTFKSGCTYDMARLTAAAHAVGALTLWDLSHSAGALPIDLEGSAADLAVGCTYKYLNGGPGAPAFLYVRRSRQAALHNPIAGWFGQADPFAFGLQYQSAEGIRRFAVGTPPLLSLTAVEPGVDLLLEAGMQRVRAKSLAQTDYLIALWETELAPLGFTLNSPRDHARRGSHIALGHPEALRIDLALIEQCGVLPDFRAPDNIRLGVAPLYTRFADLLEAVRRIRRVVVERLYERYAPQAGSVT